VECKSLDKKCHICGVEIREYIADWKTSTGLSLKTLATNTGIDQGLLSKYANGKRMPSENDLAKLSVGLNISFTELKKALIAEKIVSLVRYEQHPREIFEIAESRVEYLKSKKTFIVNDLSDSLKIKLKEIDILQAKWGAKKPLEGIQLQKLEEYFRVKYTYESNRIEGNTLTYKETHLVINEGLTIGGKPMTDHLEAINHNEAALWLKDMVTGHEDLNQKGLLDLHGIILRSINSAYAGTYRDVPVRISGSEHIPPEPLFLRQLMEEYFIHYTQQKHVMHPVILAAEMHERLISIHPFIDGNGRTSRLVMNLILLKSGYTIANLKGDYKSRIQYYAALEKVQVDNDPEPFYELIADNVKESLTEHLSMV